MDTHAPLSRRHALAGLALSASATYALARGTSRDDNAAPTTTPTPATPKAQAGTLPNGAGFYRLTMGPVTIASVADGGGTMPGSPFPLWGANATKDAVDSALQQDFLPLEGTSFHFNSTIIKVGSEVYLFDTGNGAGGGGGDAGKLVAHLAHMGIAPGDVTAVILSHLHGDHIGGLTTGTGDAALLTFPKARYLLAKAEHDFWSSAGAADIKGNLPDGFKTGAIAGAGKALAMIKSRAELLTGDAKISEHLTVRPAPGHTPGHIMLDITGAGQRLLACADLVHHFSLSFRRPDLHIQFDTDPAAGAETRMKLLDQAATDRTLILGYHMPFPGLGHVRREGTGRTYGTYSWAPMAWQW